MTGAGRAGAPLRRVAPDLYLIGLDPPDLPGFSDFIGAWFRPGPPALLVDVGPAATVPTLIGALERVASACFYSTSARIMQQEGHNG